MRPMGEIAIALKRAAGEGPATVRDFAQRAQVGLQAAKYTCSRLVARGDMVRLSEGRPAILALSAEGACVTAGAEDSQSLRELHALFFRLGTHAESEAS